MSTVYSSTGTQWPLLQSKTEQKFKSGLFNVSAEFIRPVGNTDLPTFIETSIGTVDVWPEPTVSSGTDGFERINATGYGVWDASASEVTWGLQLGILGVIVGVKPSFGAFYDFIFKNIEVFFDTVSVKKIGQFVPPIPSRNGDSGLRVYNANSTDITSSLFDISSFFPGITPSSYSADEYSDNGQILTSSFQKTFSVATRAASVQQTTYGGVIETEVVYEIASARLDFGLFTPLPPP